MTGTRRAAKGVQERTAEEQICEGTIMHLHENITMKPIIFDPNLNLSRKNSLQGSTISRDSKLKTTCTVITGARRCAVECGNSRLCYSSPEEWQAIGKNTNDFKTAQCYKARELNPKVQCRRN